MLFHATKLPAEIRVHHLNARVNEQRKKIAQTTGNTIFVTQPIDETYIFSPTSEKGRIYKIGNTKI